MNSPTPPLLAWVSTLDAPDRAAFYADLAAAVATARDRDDAAEVERCLRQWQLTAQALTNAGLRDQLLEI